MVKVGAATDVSNKKQSSIPETLTQIAYCKQKDAYCSSAVLYRGYKTKKLYAVIGKENVLKF